MTSFQELPLLLKLEVGVLTSGICLLSGLAVEPLLTRASVSGKCPHSHVVCDTIWAGAHLGYVLGSVAY